MLIKCTECGKVLTAPGGGASAQGTCPHCQATVDLARAERVGLSPGDVVGDVHIEAVIGRGGMATVYRGTQRSANRAVAVKVLAPALARRRQFVQRFQREAHVLGQLAHPNIVRILGVGTHEGLYYLAMEYVDGESLRERLTREGRLPLQEAVRLIGQVAEGLAFAHSQGILHRDIKPGNILLMADGTPKIVDFGIARIVGSDSAIAQRLTMASTQMGSAHYMAPEQMKDAASVDHRADVYALGVLLYEVLTGELPIGQFQPASKIAPGVPRSVDRVIRTALAPSPDRRFKDLGAFRSALARAVVVAAPTRVREPGPHARRAARSQSPVVPIAIGAGALVIALIVALVVLTGGRRGEHTGARRVPTSTPTVTFAPTEAQKREQAARALYAEATRRAARGDWRGAGKELDRLAREHAKTTFYPANRAAIDGLRRKIAAALQPKAPATRTPALAPPQGEPRTVEELAAAAGLEKGLAAAFYGGTEHDRFVAAMHVQGLRFNWGDGAPVPGLPPDHYSARFIGWLYVREPGEHTFQFVRDDGARLYLDGQLLINEWTIAARGKPATVWLEPGWHRTWVAYLERTGMAAFALSWGRGGDMADVPADLLYCERDLLDRLRRHPDQDPCRGLRPTDPGDVVGRAVLARPVEPGEAEAGAFFHGDLRLLPDGRVELRYDWSDAEQLRDWSTKPGMEREVVNGEARIGGVRDQGREIGSLASWDGDIDVSGACRTINTVGGEPCPKISICWTDGSGYGINCTPQRQYVWKGAGRYEDAISKAAVPFEVGKMHTVRLLREGTQIRAWIDGTLTHEASDASHTEGAVRIDCWNALVAFRDVRVVGRLSADWLAAHPGARRQVEELKVLAAKEHAAADVQKLYAEAVGRLRPAWAKRQMGDALAAAKALAGEAPLAGTGAAAWVLEDAEALAELWKAVEAGAAKLEPGEEVRVGGVQGRVEKVEGGAITVTQGPVAFAKKLTDLRTDELVALAERGRPLESGRDHLALALLSLHADKPDREAVEGELALAAEAGLDVARHRALLDALLPAPKPEPRPTTPVKPEEPEEPKRERRGPIVLTIKLRLDGVSDLVVTPAGLHWEHHQWGHPGATLVNGEKWVPQWEGDTSSVFALRPFPRTLAGLGCKVTKVEGRGRVSVKRKTASRFVIGFSDPSPGADDYEARIVIAPDRWFRGR